MTALRTPHAARPARTVLVGTALAALALGGLAAVAPPAQAAPIEDAGIEVDGGLGYDGNECTPSGSPPSGWTVLPGTGQVVKVSGSSVRSVTSTGDPADTSTVTTSASGQASARLRGGQLAELDIRGSGRARAVVPAVSECSASGNVEVGGGLQFTLVRPAWLTVTLTGTKDTSVYFGVGGAGIDSSSAGFDDGGGRATIRRYLAPGLYGIGGEIGWSTHEGGMLWVKGSSGAARKRADVAGSGRIHAVLTEAGAATGGATGSGKKYLKPGDAASCATGKVAARFTKKAKQVEKATFLVNGKKRKTVNKPKQGRTVLLPVPATRPSTVTVRLVVDPPGRRRAVTKTVTRSYEACRA
ncbi:hypothetical protein [Nocardioides sp. SYSU D00038]|uniref:hypothetical protein n=1 Tax=Nocardioides sp. SYSU D00038 TaxID=2812554 RepID=UPI00196808C4|nr:hypothetical protein [Nocardioides sp. SYSU D00038]